MTDQPTRPAEPSAEALIDWTSQDPLMVMTGICRALNTEATPENVAYIDTMKALLTRAMSAIPQ